MQIDRFAEYLPKLSEILHCKVLLLFVFAHISEKWDLIGKDIGDFMGEAQLYSCSIPFEFFSCEGNILETDQIRA